MDVLGDGRLLKSLEVHGHGEPPLKGQRVELLYETWFESKKIDGDAFDFVLGSEDVLEALDLAVATMRPGERSRFQVHHSLAYGEEGAGEIPGLALLEFLIELRDPSCKQEKQDLKQEVKKRPKAPRALEAKLRGNEALQRGELQVAERAYHEALLLLKKEEHCSEHLELQVSCLLNLAHVNLKLESFGEAERHAAAALELEPSSSKALYRRGVARLRQGDLELAREDLLKAGGALSPCVVRELNYNFNDIIVLHKL